MEGVRGGTEDEGEEDPLSPPSVISALLAMSTVAYVSAEPGGLSFHIWRVIATDSSGDGAMVPSLPPPPLEGDEGDGGGRHS